MLTTTVGQLMINESLPPDMRDYSRRLDKKSISALLKDVAKRHPDKYRAVAKKLADVGRDASFVSGGNSFGVEHLQKSVAGRRAALRIRKKLAPILSSDMPDAERDRRIVEVVSSEMESLPDEIYQEALQSGNPLAYQVLSGSRGNPMNLRSLLGSDGLYTDHTDNPVPIPILRSYSEGLTPAEYWAGAYGARRGIVDVKQATADAGYLAKQLNQITHRLLVSAKDDEEGATTGDLRGLPVDVDDADNEGALLAAPIGGYERNTVLTPRVLKELKQKGAKRILVRSPVVGGPEDGGVYARDVGVRERGDISPVGDFVGMAAAQALSEKLTQGQLCLAEGTLVRMADWSVRPIEEIRVGDFVIGADRNGRTFPVRVERTFDNGIRECLRTEFRVSRTRETVSLCSTADHKILATARRWHPRTELADPGIFPVSEKCVRLCAWMPRSADTPWRSSVDTGYFYRKSQSQVGKLPTYDIEVAHEDHLFVLANGLIVSNSSKHAGGVAGAAQSVSGFQHINQLVQIPKQFKAGAAHAQLDGKVQDIRDAPQGGKYITIDGEAHYVSPGFEPQVALGDQVEAGDVISDGIPNPSEVVKHKGIGEGRRYFTQAFRDAYAQAGMGANRRNVELIARGLINHVRLEDDMGDFVTDDVVPYSVLERNYRPRSGASIMPVKQAVGRYLERPVLHHTVGTRIRPSMLDEMQQFGVQQVQVHDDPPPFQPEMVRGAVSVSHDPDWLTRMVGSGQQKSLLSATHRGMTSDTTGTSFVPPLAEGTSFGRIGKTKGWEP